MMSTGRGLLIEVARCPVVSDCLAGRVPGHACSSVVAAQGLTRSRHQLPEPWSDDIESAPILFVESNPSFNPGERFPTSEWSDAEIERFFVTRFDEGVPPVRYWRMVHAIARDLLGRDARPGLDYALTEIIRCKSQKEAGVTEAAMDECSSRYFVLTLKIAAASVIVPLGKKAREAVVAKAETPATIGLHGPFKLSGRNRWILMLGHPSGPERKKPTAREISRVQPLLA
jgi:hypothetical protein